jgi:hypothetical protein
MVIHWIVILTARKMEISCTGQAQDGGLLCDQEKKRVSQDLQSKPFLA